MSSFALSRRNMLQLGGAAIAYAALGRVALGQDAAITVSWFGGNARADLFNSLVDMYQAQRGVTVAREFAPYADYFLRLNTQAAAGQMPDVVNFTHMEIRGFAERDRLLALDDYVASGKIDLSKFPQSVIDGGKTNGKLYGISIGNSGPVTFINEGLFKDAGVTPPSGDWTWADFEQLLISMAGKLPEGTYASPDGTKNRGLLEIFLRSKGATVFDDQGRIGFTREQMTEFLALWGRLREAKAIPDAATAAQDFSAPDAQKLFAVGKAALMSTNANQLFIWQKFQETARNDKLSLTFLPDGKKPGVSAIIGAHFGIASNSKNPDAAADFINWWINDPEMKTKYLNEHGVLGNTNLQAKVEPMLNPGQQVTASFLKEMVPIAKPYTAFPGNANDILALWDSKADNFSFGMSTAEQASDEFFSEAASIAEIANP